jgi:fermentation-respiration switch protein FrsA (DUF1100 family)
VVWGESLDTGVAVALASKQPVGRLIPEAPFTSAVEIAGLSYPLIPVSLLMKDQFRSDARIGAITVPTLVLHGELDRVVPIAFGERLYSAIRAPKRFVRFADGEHEGPSTSTARFLRCATSWLPPPPTSIDRHHEMACGAWFALGRKRHGPAVVPRDSKTAARSMLV